MKLNFSLHFRCFMAGVIVLFAVMMLAFGIPSYEDSVLAEGLEDTFADFEEDFFFNLLYALFFIFSAYAVGMFLDSLYRPFKQSERLSSRLERFIGCFPEGDVILARFCNRMDDKKLFSAADVYKYISSYIAAANDNLNKEVQGALSKLYIVTALSVASVLLLLAFAVQLCFYDYGCDEEFVSYVALAAFFAVCLLFLQFLKRRCRMEILDTVERNYYVLTQCKSLRGSGAANEEKVNMEVGG